MIQVSKKQEQQEQQQKPTMVLNTEWTQLETIELLCETSMGSGVSRSTVTSPNSATSQTTTTTTDKSHLNVTSGGLNASSGSSGSSSGGGGGGGFGFGITGNKSTGVVVKAITPGGYAQKVCIYTFKLYIIIDYLAARVEINC